MSRQLPEIVRGTLARHGPLAPGARVLAAVSGGVDSMALAHVLRELGHDVQVAHFDHETRAGGSAADAAFVAATCADLGIPCHTGHWRDWPRGGAGGSFEMEARARRYAFLAHTARAAACAAIATGHHAGDQAETVMLRVLRGTGVDGLAGIAPSRRVDGVLLVRPLLGCTRTEIMAWATARGLRWREDPSNLDTAHERNWVRHVLLPMIADAQNPQIAAVLSRLADTARVDVELLGAYSEDACAASLRDNRLQREAFRALHEALRRRVLQTWLRPCGAGLEHALILQADAFAREAKTGQRLSIGGGMLLHAAHGEILIAADSIGAGAPETPLTAPGECVYLRRRFCATLTSTAPSPLREFCTPTRQVFDADALGTTLSLRTRRDGDTFVPLGMSSPRKLQDFFVDRHVPRPDRDAVPLVLSQGEIAWIVGHMPSARFAVTPATTRFAIIEVMPCD